MAPLSKRSAEPEPARQGSTMTVAERQELAYEDALFREAGGDPELFDFDPDDMAAPDEPAAIHRIVVPEAPSRPPWRLIAATAAIVVLAAGLAFTGWRVRSDNAASASRSAVVQAASRFATDFTTYDYLSVRGATSSLAAAQGMETGAFEESSAASVASLVDFVVQSQARATGKVIAAGVTSSSGSKGEVLLFVDQTVTTAATPSPSHIGLRMKVDLVRQNGTWLVNDSTIPT